MATGLANLLLGADYAVDDVFCFALMNLVKNHWRADYVGIPCTTLSQRQPGMTISDAHDEKFGPDVEERGERSEGFAQEHVDAAGRRIGGRQLGHAKRAGGGDGHADYPGRDDRRGAACVLGDR